MYASLPDPPPPPQARVWFRDYLLLSYDNQTTTYTLTILNMYCTGETEMPQLHTWQPLSVCLGSIPGDYQPFHFHLSMLCFYMNHEP